MSQATQIVHWPGKDSPVCDRHAEQAKGVARAMGFTVSTTPWVDDGTSCKNCENEAEKLNASKS